MLLRKHFITVIATVFCLGLAAGASAQDFTWHFDDVDGPSNGWGDNPPGMPYYEYMFDGAPEDDDCSWIDLPTVTWPDWYYAHSYPENFDFSGFHFWADVWLANNYDDLPNDVEIELWRGYPDGGGTFLASDIVTVTNQLVIGECGEMYTFDFGTIQDLYLVDEPLVLVIKCIGVDYNTHIYWDSWDSPSALHAEAGDPPIFTDIGADILGLYIGSVDWGDYDDDGDLDVLVTGRNYATNPYARVYNYDHTTETYSQAANLLGVAYSDAAWGDYDNDGDLDIALTGSSTSGYKTRIYENDGGTFVHDTSNVLKNLAYSSIDWGDYDNDGDLDLLIVGFNYHEYVPYSFIYRNDDGVFVDAEAGLLDLYWGVTAFGDYDADGDLDIVITGTISDNVTRQTVVYENVDGTFTDIGAGLPGVRAGAVAWGDYDNDCDLDLLLSGHDGTNRVARIYEYDMGSFTDIGAGLPQGAGGAGCWGDYDNDGDLDLFFSCHDGTTRHVDIYENNGGTFTPINDGLASISGSEAAWGDYDNDGDLDLLLAGGDGSVAYTKVYSNELNIPNTAPNAPTNLRLAFSGSTFSLEWDPATDAETGLAGLTYNLRAGTTPGAIDIATPMSDLSTGYRKVARFGDIACGGYFDLEIADITELTQFCWSVQTIDGGLMGSPFSGEHVFALAPVVTSITDVANDQGRQVSIEWSRSDFDAPGQDYTITGYSVWRRIDDIEDDGEKRAVPRDGKAHQRIVKDGGLWHYISTVPARGETDYAVVAPTLCDSTVSGICYSTFFISAMTADPLAFFDSAPDSGYSVDNLAPQAPSQLKLVGPRLLTWEDPVDEDFDYFSVYAADTDVFDENAVLIGHTVTPEMALGEPPYPFYFVVATDFAGNQSMEPVAFDYQNSVPEALPTRFALGANVPNPFNPATTISFELPESCRARLSIYGVDGRRVAVLVDEDRPAGKHAVAWNGLDDQGSRVASGVYLYRLEAGDFRSTKRMTLLK